MPGVPPSATARRAGERGASRGPLRCVVKRYEGSVAKSLSIEIVRVVFALLSYNARGSPPRAASAHGPRWAKIGLFFSWKIEIVFYFNSELNFGN